MRSGPMRLRPRPARPVSPCILVDIDGELNRALAGSATTGVYQRMSACLARVCVCPTRFCQPVMAVDLLKTWRPITSCRRRHS